jgi:hypothetical protein
LGCSKNIEDTKDDIKTIRTQTLPKKLSEIKDSIPEGNIVNVIIKREDLKKEINYFIDTLFSRKDTLKEINGVTLIIMKNTEVDLAIKLVYATPGCSIKLVGITDYEYENMMVYLLSDNVGINNDFFELKYKAICEKLEDWTTVINKTHYLPFYGINITYYPKILYYQKKDGEFVLTNIFYNDFDVPGIRDK